MPEISTGTAILGGGALQAVSGLLGGANSSNAATQAAQVQATAAHEAAQNQLAEFGQIRSDLAPFRDAGSGAISTLAPLIGTAPGTNPLTAPLTRPFAPTLAQLQSTPGYQFVLDQGQKAVTNSFAAQGLGSSGAALKGAANYAEGLAGTTFQQQFQNYLAQNQQIYNMISGQGNLGENAAAQTGALGTQNTLAANNFATSGAAATAGGIVGSANALNSALSGVSGAGSSTGLLLAFNQGGLFGKSGGAAGSSGGGGNTLTSPVFDDSF